MATEQQVVPILDSSPTKNARIDGPSKIIKKIIKNAYKVKLPGDCNILPTFKVKDLKRYHGEDLRT